MQITFCTTPSQIIVRLIATAALTYIIFTSALQLLLFETQMTTNLLIGSGITNYKFITMTQNLHDKIIVPPFQTIITIIHSKNLEESKQSQV